MNIVVLEIDVSIMIPRHLMQHIKNSSMFFGAFVDKSFSLLHENNMHILDLPLLLNHIEIADYEITINQLNNFAKNRLIKNFENTYPEITFVLMDCGVDSKLIKIKRKK